MKPSLWILRIQMSKSGIRKVFEPWKEYSFHNLVVIGSGVRTDLDLATNEHDWRTVATTFTVRDTDQVNVLQPSPCKDKRVDFPN